MNGLCPDYPKSETAGGNLNSPMLRGACRDGVAGHEKKAARTLMKPIVWGRKSPLWERRTD